MGPTSKVLIVLVLLGAVGLFVLIIRSRRLGWKIAAGVGAFTLSMATGVLAVNDYYGYYTTWGSAVADISGNSNGYAANQAAAQVLRHGRSVGRMEVVDLTGRRSGINRQGLVYLPPQYFERAYRKERFPVLELFHGTPGDPAQWVNQMRVTELVAQLIDTHRIGPMVLVMPDSNGGLRKREECLNIGSVKDDTYVSRDVPADIRAKFRVSRDSAQWGLLGVSSGGYCAANLMMRHRGSFGAVAAVDGYFRPQDGTAGRLLQSDPTQAQANDPQLAASRMQPGAGPLPPFFVSAGTGEYSDYVYSKRMVDVMRRLETVPFLVMQGRKHTMGAVRDALPSALIWSWQQLCTPAQRRQFPTIDPGLGVTVATAPIHRLLVTTHQHKGGSTLTLGGSAHQRMGAKPNGPRPVGSRNGVFPSQSPRVLPHRRPVRR